MATSARLTVLQMLPALQGGGVERGTLEIAEALVRAGHRSLVMSAGGALVDRLRAGGTEHLCWPVGAKRLRSVTLVRPLRRLLRDREVDILHLRSRLPAWIGWLAWRKLPVSGRPHLVTTVHGAYSVSRYSAVMTRGERVIAVSQFIREYVLEHYRSVDPAALVVIPRGIDPAFFARGFRPDPQWLQAWQAAGHVAAGEKVITLAGRLTRLKGHGAFIDLVRDLRAAGLPVRGLVVGGEDPRRTAYAQEIYAHAEGTPVAFLGQRRDVREILSISDLVVSLSSQPESFGRSVLEALALGTPVVGYDHGGVGEILAQMYPFGAVPPGDRAATAERAAKALVAPAAVPTTQPYTLAAMQARTLALYAELGERRRADGR